LAPRKPSFHHRKNLSRRPLLLRVLGSNLSRLPTCSEVTQTVRVIENMRAYETVAHHEHTPIFCEFRRNRARFDLLFDLGESPLTKLKEIVAAIVVLVDSAMANEVARRASVSVAVVERRSVPSSASSFDWLWCKRCRPSNQRLGSRHWSRGEHCIPNL
jgi:hypothetical protein